jgi:hypothetical protein
LETLPQNRKSTDSAHKLIDFTFYSLYHACMKSIRDILREEMEECTQIRANELAILKFCQRAGRKQPGLVELEKEELLIGRDR